MNAELNNADKNKKRIEEYRKEYNEIWDTFILEEEKIESEYPDGWWGENHPATNKVFMLRKKLYSDIKELQKEYHDILPLLPNSY